MVKDAFSAMWFLEAASWQGEGGGTVDKDGTRAMLGVSLSIDDMR